MYLWRDVFVLQQYKASVEPKVQCIKYVCFNKVNVTVCNYLPLSSVHSKLQVFLDEKREELVESDTSVKPANKHTEKVQILVSLQSKVEENSIVSSFHHHSDECESKICVLSLSGGDN